MPLTPFTTLTPLTPEKIAIFVAVDEYSSSPVQYLRQLRLLLETEYNCEKEEFRRQTEAMGLQRKVKRGDAWLHVSVGRSYYNSLNQLAVEVMRTQDKEIEHNFEFGRPVAFFTVKETPSKGSEAPSGRASILLTGTVSYVDGDRMVVTVPNNAPLTRLQTEENVGVQLFFDETTYRLMFEALDRVIGAKNNRLAYLRDLFASRQKAETFSFDPIRFPGSTLRRSRR